MILSTSYSAFIIAPCSFSSSAAATTAPTSIHMQMHVSRNAFHNKSSIRSDAWRRLLLQRKGDLNRQHLFFHQRFHVDGMRSFLTNQRSQSSLYMHNNNDNDGQSVDFDEWEAGDVTTDMKNLKIAVLKSRAEDDLLSKNRIDLLNEFARQRRELLPDLRRFILLPLLVSFSIVLSSLFLDRRSERSWRRLIETFVWGIVRFMDLWYWSVGVVTPLYLWLLKRIQYAGKQRKRLDQIQDTELSKRKLDLSSPSLSSSFLPSSRLAYLNDSYVDYDEDNSDGMINSKKDCSDFILCLLENWSSSSIGAFLLGFQYLLLNRNVQLSASLSASMPSSFCTKNKWTVLAMTTTQLINRLSAAASIHQYPKLLYQLQNVNQPKPLTQWTNRMQTLVNFFMVLLPLGFACDLAKWIINLIHAFRTKAATATTTPISYSAISIASVLKKLFLHNKASSLLKLTILFTAITSTVHLCALYKIIQVQFFTNMSLAEDYHTAKARFDSSDIAAAGFKWRYKLVWREPKRFSQSIRSLWRDFLVYILSGWGDEVGNNSTSRIHRSIARGTSFAGRNLDGRGVGSFGRQIRRRKASKLFLFGRKRTSEKKSVYDSEQEQQQQRIPDPKIISLIKEEFARNGLEIDSDNKSDRTTWVPNATKRMAEIHQENYDKKSFEDPLGIAVQQTLGVGLSLDFDHDTRLKKGEEPSIHRLRARAAKSAIKRINQIPVEIKEKVDKISNVEDKMRIGLKLAEESRFEVRKYADALLTYIPTNAPPPEGKNVDLETILMSDVITTKNNLPPIPDPNNFVASQEDAPDPWKKAIEREFGEDFVDDPYLNAQEVFVHEFLKKYGKVSSNNDMEFVEKDNKNRNDSSDASSPIFSTVQEDGNVKTGRDFKFISDWVKQNYADSIGDNDNDDGIDKYPFNKENDDDDEVYYA